MYGKVFLWFFSMFFLVACEDNSKFELLPDAMESKGLADSIIGEEKEVLLNELKELKEEILFLGEPVTEKGRIYNPKGHYTEADIAQFAQISVLIEDDFFRVNDMSGDPFQKIFYKEMWVFRCKSDTITYDPKTIGEANPPKCRDGKTLDKKKYKQSIEAVRLWLLLKENEKDSVTTYSAYDKLAEWFKNIRNDSIYKDVDLVNIALEKKENFYDEIYIDRFIKVAKLARDAGFYRFHPGIFENDDDESNDYERLLNGYKIVKNIPEMQYYPGIYLGESSSFRIIIRTEPKPLKDAFKRRREIDSTIFGN